MSIGLLESVHGVAAPKPLKLGPGHPFRVPAIAMFLPKPVRHEQVDQLLRNARLRDELEPLLDESIAWVDSQRMPTETENELLESMLEWERAPMAPIRDWFDPPLDPPPLAKLNALQLRTALLDVVDRLFQKRIVLYFTDHLSDRALYALILRDILPSYEKKLERGGAFLHWDCSGIDDDPQDWLTYYASDEERQIWEEETGLPCPDRADPPFRRDLPTAPL